MATPPNRSTPPPAPAAGGARPARSTPRWVIWAAAAVSMALILFLVGLFVGRGPVSDLRLRADAAEARAVRAESRANAQEALVLLYQTVLDLDARNFGTANDRLQRAASLLGQTDGAGLNTDVAALQDLRQRVAATDLRVAEDLDAQRAAVLGYARRLNELLGGDS